MAADSTARLDEIATETWPEWAPLRHQSDIHAFEPSEWETSALGG